MTDLHSTGNVGGDLHHRSKKLSKWHRLRTGTGNSNKSSESNEKKMYSYSFVYYIREPEKALLNLYSKSL